jgi:hypothetical protein
MPLRFTSGAQVKFVLRARYDTYSIVLFIGAPQKVRLFRRGGQLEYFDFHRYLVSAVMISVFLAKG